jgi:hypothetical protein
MQWSYITVLPLLSLTLYIGTFFLLRDLKVFAIQFSPSFFLVLAFLALWVCHHYGFFYQIFIFCALLISIFSCYYLFNTYIVLPAYYIYELVFNLFFSHINRFSCYHPLAIAYLCSIICCLSLIFILFPYSVKFFNL